MRDTRLELAGATSGSGASPPALWFHIVHALWVGVIIKMSTDQNATSHPRGMILRSFRRGWL